MEKVVFPIMYKVLKTSFRWSRIPSINSISPLKVLKSHCWGDILPVIVFGSGITSSHLFSTQNARHGAIAMGSFG